MKDADGVEADEALDHRDYEHHVRINALLARKKAAARSSARSLERSERSPK